MSSIFGCVPTCLRHCMGQQGSARLVNNTATTPGLLRDDSQFNGWQTSEGADQAERVLAQEQPPHRLPGTRESMQPSDDTSLPGVFAQTERVVASERHLHSLLGTWVESNAGPVAVIFKMDEHGGCHVEERRTSDGSLIASGELQTRANAAGWWVWNRSHYGGKCLDDWPERFRISDEDGDVLLVQLLETWGDWADLDRCYRRCTDEFVLHTLSPSMREVEADNDAKPVRISRASDETVLLGSSDGYVSLITSGSPSWSEHVRTLLPQSVRVGFEYGVNSVVFSPDGTRAFLSVGAGESEARGVETSGFVICLNASTGELVWMWHAQTLRNPSSLHVEALSLTLRGDSIAAGCNRKAFLGFDGTEMPAGDDCLVYLSTYSSGAKAELVWKQTYHSNIAALAHSPHSIYLVVGFRTSGWYCCEHTLCVATESGHSIWRCELPGQRLADDWHGGALSFSPGGRFVAIAAWGHSCEEHDDFNGSACAQVDEDDMCTVTCVGVESGQIKWRSKPVQDDTCGAMELLFSPSGQYILVACKLNGEFGSHRRKEGFYQGAAVYLKASNGQVVKKAYIDLPDTLSMLALKHCTDSQAVFAVDAWDMSDTAVRVYRLPLNGPPPDWEGFSYDRRNFAVEREKWPSPIEHEILWSCSLPRIKGNLKSLAFMPLPPSTRVSEEEEEEKKLPSDDGGHSDDGGNADEAQSSNWRPKRRSRHQRERQKKWRSNVQVGTPSSWD